MSPRTIFAWAIFAWVVLFLTPAQPIAIAIGESVFHSIGVGLDHLGNQYETPGLPEATS